MIGRTLGFYFAKLFLKNIFLIFLLISFLIIAVDLTDQARRMSRHPDVPFADFLIISLAKTPGFAERVLPFAVLFGCIGTLILLNRKMELVVARAAGVSVWQFIWPAAISAIAVGLFSALLFNPLALSAARYGKDLEARVYGGRGNVDTDRSRNLWIRQSSNKGDMIIHAAISREKGTVLNGVTAYRFEQSGYLKERIDADRAGYIAAQDGKSAQMTFHKVNVTVSGKKSLPIETYQVETNLTAGQLDGVSTRPEDLSFWQLLTKIEQTESAGKISNNFRMQFQSLFARPLFFVAMVFIAGTVSLRFVRFGQNSKIVLTGILAGFVLYVVTELVIGFGKNGIVPPWLAAWYPPTVAALISVTILLHQEDG